MLKGRCPAVLRQSTYKTLLGQSRAMAVQGPEEIRPHQNGSDSEWEGTTQDSQLPAEEPPGMFATIGLMGFGAVGAVGVAVLGVMAVFQMANTVASGTGRSIMVGRDNPEGSDKTIQKLRGSEK